MFDFLVEFAGTFFFLSVILTVGQPIPIAIALLAAIYFGGHLSGGHFNPAISTMFLAKGTLSIEKYIGYVLAQVLGGLLALTFYRLSTKTKGK
jgi:aquaporin Z